MTKRVLMGLAVVVILLHNVIAHQHESELSDEEHISAHNCAVTVLDNIVLGFHVDGGEGHLEHFVASDSDVEFNYTFVESFSTPQVNGEVAVIFNSDHLPFYSNPGFQLFPLRGPPGA